MSDPVPSSAISDATTGGRSVIVITGGATGDVLTLQADGTYSAVTPSGGVTGTGSVDNAALRADGTGGATLQSSAWIIADNYTASPNNTINHGSLQATGGTTNVSVSIVPKAAGAFMLAVPDGTATGGNVRGANAVDLQTSRAAATQVASGASSFLVGASGTASGTGSVSFSSNVTGQYSLGSGLIGGSVSGNYSVGLSCSTPTISGTLAVGICGDFLTVSGSRAFGHGYIPGLGGATVAADGSVGLAGGGSVSGADHSVSIGQTASTTRWCQLSHSGGRFAAVGDSQSVHFLLMRKTTDATPTTMFLNSGSTLRLTIPSGKMMFADLIISGIKSDGSAAACYKRKVAIKNVGGTTSLVGTVETIGTDIEDNAATDVTITADNTNDALDISVTGIAAETWRWVAVVDGLEIAYGT